MNTKNTSSTSNTSVIITTCTPLDVLNGRGQKVQSHPGNVKYRTLVFVNKGLYARCPRNDKIKISKGIVNAIRKLGGRYLVLNEQTGTYTDIGDKKATEKTSQALREGQAQIKKDIRSQEEGDGKSKSESSLLPLPPPIQMNVKAGEDMLSEDYFRNSLEVLKSLYHAENNMTREMAVRPAPNSVATQLKLQSAVSSAHMADVRDQFDFDGMVPDQLQQRQQQQSQQQHLELETRLSPNTSPLASKTPPRPRSCSSSPDLRQSDTLSLSSWSLSNSSVSGMSFLSLSDTFSTAAEAEACAGTNTTGTDGGGGGDQDCRAEAEEGTELMQLIELELELEPELGLRHIQVMNMNMGTWATYA